MKQAFRSVRVLLWLSTLCLTAPQTTRAGGIVVTGHDMLFHVGQAGYDQVILDYLRNGSEPAASYTIGVIGSGVGPFGWGAFSSGTSTPPGGYPTATLYDTALLDSNPALQAAALANDVLIIISHQTCGGCDLSTAGSDIVNSQMAAGIAAAFSCGMDLWVNAGALLSSYYDFLPPAVGVTGTSISETLFCATPAGAGIGILPAHTTGFETHNRFDVFSPQLTVLETDCGAGTKNITLGAQDVGELILDFEPLMHDDAQVVNHAPALGGRYKQNGFQVIHDLGSAQLNTYGKQHGFFSGSTAMHGTSHQLAAAGSLTVVDAPFAAPPLGYLIAQTTFAPVRVLLTERDSSTPAGTNVTFTGYFPDNSTVSQTFSLDGNLATSESFGLVGFEGVKYLEWPMIQQIDDICIVDTCSDGLDNDGDGLIDADDPDCAGVDPPGEHLFAAPPPVPALPGFARWLVGAGMCLVAWTATSRRRRR